MKKLEAKDIMLGDWVSYLNGFSEGEMTIHTQVASIRKDGITESRFGKFIELDRLQPIPLTPEILKRNNAELLPGTFADMYKIGNVVVDDFGSGHFDSKIVQHGYTYATEIQLCYVHQLQHLLRLCGVEVEKEITL